MAQILGSVRVGGFIAPTDTADTYAVTDDIYNRGGYKTVDTIALRDAITVDRRKEGMSVFVNNRTTPGTWGIYVLYGGITNADWLLILSSDGGGGGHEDNDLIDVKLFNSGDGTTVYTAIDGTSESLDYTIEKVVVKVLQAFDSSTASILCRLGSGEVLLDASMSDLTSIDVYSNGVDKIVSNDDFDVLFTDSGTTGSVRVTTYYNLPIQHPGDNDLTVTEHFLHVAGGSDRSFLAIDGIGEALSYNIEKVVIRTDSEFAGASGVSVRLSSSGEIVGSGMSDLTNEGVCEIHLNLDVSSENCIIDFVDSVDGGSVGEAIVTIYYNV